MTPKEFFSLGLKPGDRVTVAIGRCAPVPAFFDGYKTYTRIIRNPEWDLFPIFRAVSRKGKMLPSAPWNGKTTGEPFSNIVSCRKSPEQEVKDFFFIREEDRRDLCDSLLFDSGQEILSGTVGDLRVSVVVCGDVRIVWNGESHRTPSHFPDDLREVIRGGTLDSDERAYIDMNNWFESRIWRGDKLLEEDVVDDLSGMDDNDAKGWILDVVKDYISTDGGQPEMPFVCIAVFGEEDCKKAIDETKEETHTVEEWQKIFDQKNCFTEVHRFRTEDEMNAFASGIERADNYFSSDFYTVMVLKERITD